jgi:hypothetical protein
MAGSDQNGSGLNGKHLSGPNVYHRGSGDTIAFDQQPFHPHVVGYRGAPVCSGPHEAQGETLRMGHPGIIPERTARDFIGVKGGEQIEALRSG